MPVLNLNFDSDSLAYEPFDRWNFFTPSRSSPAPGIANDSPLLASASAFTLSRDARVTLLFKGSRVNVTGIITSFQAPLSVTLDGKTTKVLSNAHSRRQAQIQNTLLFLSNLDAHTQHNLTITHAGSGTNQSFSISHIEIKGKEVLAGQDPGPSSWAESLISTTTVFQTLPNPSSIASPTDSLPLPTDSLANGAASVSSDLSIPNPSSSATLNRPPSNRLSSMSVVGVSVGSIAAGALMAALFALLFLCMRRRKRESKSATPTIPSEPSRASLGHSVFETQEILTARPGYRRTITEGTWRRNAFENASDEAHDNSSGLSHLFMGSSEALLSQPIVRASPAHSPTINHPYNASSSNSSHAHTKDPYSHARKASFGRRLSVANPDRGMVVPIEATPRRASLDMTEAESRTSTATGPDQEDVSPVDPFQTECVTPYEVHDLQFGATGVQAVSRPFWAR